MSLQNERQRFLNSLYFPSIFVLILWLVKITEYSFNTSFSEYGLYPRTVEGLLGIFTHPFIHGGDRGEILGNFAHLFSNSAPLLMLGTLVFYSYEKVAWRAIGLIFACTGIIMWVAARPSHHIGASGIVYGLAFFIIASGLFRRNIRAIALALLVVFYYNGLLFGLLPVQPHISWEGHLAGAIAGTLAAYYFKNIGKIERKRYSWEDEPEEDEIIERPYWVKYPTQPTNSIDTWEVKYNIVPSKKEPNQNANNT